MGTRTIGGTGPRQVARRPAVRTGGEDHDRSDHLLDDESSPRSGSPTWMRGSLVFTPAADRHPVERSPISSRQRAEAIASGRSPRAPAAADRTSRPPPARTRARSPSASRPSRSPTREEQALMDQQVDGQDQEEAHRHFHPDEPAEHHEERVDASSIAPTRRSRAADLEADAETRRIVRRPASSTG